jgi:NifU-like protein
MAKNSLISGSIWDEYSNQVVNRMNNPSHQGEITEERAAALGAKLIVADFGAESCGDAVRLYWAVDEANDENLRIKIQIFWLWYSNCIF